MPKFVLSFMLLICVLALPGCFTNQALKYTTAEQVAADSEVEVDPYKDVTWVRTPYISVYPMGFRFRYLEGDFGIGTYQLYINYFGPDWVFFNSAYDSDGRELDFVKIGSDVRSGGSITETFGIRFPRSYLEEKARGDGLNIKVVGQRGDQIFTWRPIWIQGFLMKVDDPDGDFGQGP